MFKSHRHGPSYPLHIVSLGMELFLYVGYLQDSQFSENMALEFTEINMLMSPNPCRSLNFPYQKRHQEFIFREFLFDLYYL